MLPGRHLEGCQGQELGGDCGGCQPCLEAHCRNCHREHADDTCPGCLNLARENLHDLRELMRHLPRQATEGRQAYHVGSGIPGGDATVMLAPAAPGWPPGLAVAVTVELSNDPRPPLDVLTYWVNVWVSCTEAEAHPPTTLVRVVAYLDRELHHIAGDPLFPQLARDLAQLLHQVENVTHAGYRPDLSRVPCLDCATRLVKVWAEAEAHDHYRCPACGQVYDQGRYERAQHDQLASRGAARFVPLMDAVAVTARAEQTIRAWARDGLVESRRTPTGRIEVWWPDVRDRHRVTPVRTRRSA